MEAWPIKALKAAPISRKLEIAQNAKTCSKQKKVA